MISCLHFTFHAGELQREEKEYKKINHAMHAYSRSATNWVKKKSIVSSDEIRTIFHTHKSVYCFHI